MHPLRARHHDTEDVRDIARAIDDRVRVLRPDAWFWDDAFHSAFVVNYGSSSIYELWSAGIRSAVVCNFEGTARSEKFAAFRSVFIDDHDEYREFVAEEEWRSLRLDSLAREVSDAYEALCDGRATERAAEIVTGGSSRCRACIRWLSSGSASACARDATVRGRTSRSP